MQPIGEVKRKTAVWILDGKPFTSDITLNSDVTVTAVYDYEEIVSPMVHP